MVTCQKNGKAEYYAFDEVSESLVRKRVKIPLSFHSKKARIEEANKLIAEINSLLEKGFYFKSDQRSDGNDNSQASIQDLVSLFESVLETIAPVLRAKSEVTYRSAVNKLKAYAGDGILNIADFTNRDATIFRDYLMKSLANTARTANNTMSYLNTLYGYLQVRIELPENPFKLKKLRQIATNKNIAFVDADKKEVEEYMRKHEPELFIFTRFIYFAFIRPGELNSIRVSDIREKEKYILVRGEVSKNGKTETVLIIRPLLEEFEGLNLFETNQTHYLFGFGLVPGRSQLSKQVAFRRHEKVLKQLNLLEKGYTLYSWKHTGAVNAYRSGVGIKQLQILLRHRTVQMTDMYLKSLGLRTDPNIENYSW